MEFIVPATKTEQFRISFVRTVGYVTGTNSLKMSMFHLSTPLHLKSAEPTSFRPPVLPPSITTITTNGSCDVFYPDPDQGNELTRNSSENTRPQSSQLAEPLWTDPGLKSGSDVHGLIYKQANKQKTSGE